MSVPSVSAQEADRAAPGASGETLPHSEAPVVVAVRTSSSIQIDGMPDEAAWAAATPMTNFTQIDPFEGEPVSQPTDVRFLFDDDALYIGGRFYDSGPIMTRLARRDTGVSDSDLFTVSIDSYHDHQTSYRFTTNPSGIKRDATVTSGGRGDGGGDSSWDPVWDVVSIVTDEGWFTEMRIPFSQLRFSPADDLLWGIQVERNIRRIEERAVFSFTPKLERGGVARYGHLTGIRGIGGGRRLELLPYIGMSAEYIYQEPSSQVAFENPFRSGSDYFGRMGVDLKYRLGSNLTLDGAVNPDFGQVEVDPAVINLTAFETRFQERRPFFVEGAEIFRFGRGGPTGSTGRAPQVLYSRRIGRRPQGGVAADAVYSDAPVSTTILGAAKITGKVGDGWSVGLIDAVTGREYAPYVDAAGVDGRSIVEPTTNYLAGRVRRDMRAGETQLGMIATAVHRDIGDPGLASRLRSAAYVAGADLVHEWNNRGWKVSSAFATSYIQGDPASILGAQRSSARYLQRPDATHLGVDSAATSMGGFYHMAEINKQAGSFTGRIGTAYLSPGYEVNDLGFQTETERFILDTHFQWNQPRPGRYLRNWSVMGGPDNKWNTAGDWIFSDVNLQFRWRWLNYWGGSVRGAVRPSTKDDRLTRGGPMTRRPGSALWSANLDSDSRKSLNVSARYNGSSDAAGSWQHSGSLNFTYRSGEKLELRLGPAVTRSYSAAQYVTATSDDLATSTFGRRYVFAPIDQTTVSLVTRLNVTFSPTLTLQVYAQPLISSGDYGDLGELQAPDTYRFSTYGEDIGTSVRQADGNYLIDPDGPGPAPEFTVSDRSFNLRSLLGNAVLRWEWSPGSTLFLVWQQRRAGRLRASEFDETGALDVGTFDLGYDTRELFGLDSDNIFLIKVNYWLNF
ncbi:MAG: carbohydrate binding family 9 domain-containing protein [Gemmatimonadetes bacterium]|nr:carbohydrate binding family 9 domain-containing protein [Gemmatimonadota bacterium]